MARFLAALWAFFALVAAASAQTGERVRTGHAESRLLAEKTAAVPGETLWVAFAQELEEGWHVYWKNPGDSGLPLELRWDLPSGFVAGEIHYPLPHRLPLGPLTNFGHEGRPLFLVEIEVPETATPGETVQFRVDAEWLICLDVCIPERASLSLTMPVAATATDAPGNAARIRKARSALPRVLDLPAQFTDDDGFIVLKVANAPDGDPYFFPALQGITEPTPPQPALRDGGALFLRMVPGLDYPDTDLNVLEGVLALSMAGEEVGIVVKAVRDDALAIPQGFPAIDDVAAAANGGGLAASDAVPASSAPGAPGLAGLFVLALLGGLVLNAMPCVFPVVFLKAAGLVALAGAERRAVRADAFAYTAGVLVTFLAMALLLLVLRGAGAQLGWGFQLQSPMVVGAFALVVFLIGLNLAGLFEVGTSLQNVGGGLTQKKGLGGSFFTGVLAVLVAAPCIGPFLGVPIGYALTAPPLAAFAVFLALGLGLALPYLALAFVPGLAAKLPRPGPWMVRMKQFFSFPMFATAVWLTWVVALQAGPQAVIVLGAAFVLAAMAAWLYGLSQAKTTAPLLRTGAAGLLAAGLAPLLTLNSVAPLPPATTASNGTVLTKEPYDETRLAALTAEGTPVFVDFTAAWCITCQYNKKVVLDTPEVKDLFAATGTVFMVADLTSPDPVITAAIERQGRSGVPLYLYYDGAGGMEILPQILTTGMMRSTLEGSS